MTRFARRTTVVTLFALSAVMACSQDSSVAPVTSYEIVLKIFSGDEQVGSIGTSLPLPLMVRVTRPTGEPVPGLAVQWVATSLDNRDAELSARTSTTDSAGIARTELILGGKVATQYTTATVSGQKVQFKSIAQTQGASSMLPTPGDQGFNQVDTVLSVLRPYKVLILDYLGKPVAGVVVRWNLRVGGGSLAPESVSDANGIAQTTFKVGPYALVTRVEASVTGLPGSPVRFESTINPGNPVKFVATEGDNQYGKIKTPLRPYYVRVQDSYGNSVKGVPVEWAVVSGAGTLSSVANVTGTYGATATHNLGPAEGLQTVRATAAGMPATPDFAPVTFSPTAVQELVLVASTIDDYYGYDSFALVPQTVKVAVGTEVTWLWECNYCNPPKPILHNITFEDVPTEPTSSPTQSTGTHKRTFTKPGTYNYRCTIHSTSFTEGPMIGSIIVQ